MDTHPAPRRGTGVTVRRAKRTDLGPVFALIQHARGGVLSSEEIIRKATGYGYLIAEAQERIIGVAGMLMENSVVCVRDLHAAGASTRGLATAVLMDAIEGEAGALACEAIIVQMPPGTPVMEALLRDRRYQRRTLDEMKRLWREVAREQFEPDAALWVNNLRELR